METTMRAECTSLPVGLIIMMRSVESIDEHLWILLLFGLLSTYNWFAGKVDTCYICYLPGDCFRLTEFVTVIIYLTHCYPEVVLCILPYILISNEPSQKHF